MTQAPAAGAQTSNLQRTAVLLSFSALVVASQVLWLSFASITDKTADKLGVSEGAVGDLAVINAAMFVVLAIPAGRWMDRHYGRTLAAGALFTAVGALIRFADPGSYAVICAGQVVMSIGQPLILNGLTKITARYYPQEKRTTAISIGSASQFVGILIAVLTGAPLFDAGKLPLVLGVDAAIAVVAAVAVLVSLRVPPAYEVEVPEAESMAWLRGDRTMWWLAALLFVGFGSYNALATWLDSIMVDFGHKNTAGAIIAIMTLAGVAGAAVLPGVAAARDARRAVALTTTVLLAVALVAIVFVHTVAVVGILLAILGIFLLGTLPVALDWSELHVGGLRAGTATGVLLLAGNLGGVIVVLTVQAVIGHPTAALLVMAAWAVPGFVIALRLPRTVGAAGVGAA
ncbi:MAG TPA: MFS transporter [Marmoricola sp.]